MTIIFSSVILITSRFAHLVSFSIRLFMYIVAELFFSRPSGRNFLPADDNNTRERSATKKERRKGN